MKGKLLKKVALEKGFRIRDLARLSKIGRLAFLLSLWGLREFRLLEIVRISEVLKIDKEFVEEIFFG